MYSSNQITIQFHTLSFCVDNDTFLGLSDIENILFRPELPKPEIYYSPAMKKAMMAATGEAEGLTTLKVGIELNVVHLATITPLSNIPTTSLTIITYSLQST